jgi:hypothetical protein
MSRLKDPTAPPPLFYTVSLGGRLKRIPRSGHMASLDNLYQSVQEFYRNNADPIPEDLKQRIEDQICTRYPDKCRGDRVHVPGIPVITPKDAKRGIVQHFTGRSIAQLTVASKALWQNAEGKTESQPVIESRASVCRSGNNGKRCPMLLASEEAQKAAAGCQQCGGKQRAQNTAEATKGAVKAVLSSIGIKPSYTLPPDMEGLGCGACGCFMDSLLPATEELLSTKQDSIAEDAKRPSYCWARPIIQRP